MKDILIRRKRLLPLEDILLKDDVILSSDDSCIVTSWSILRPRKDHLTHGFSCYYLKEDLKVSRMIRSDGSFYWYCDIADYTWDEAQHTLIMTDLLADVVVTPDGAVRVMDLDELAKAHDLRLIDDQLLKKSLYTLDRLLRELYADGVTRLAAPISKIHETR